MLKVMAEPHVEQPRLQSVVVEIRKRYAVLSMPGSLYACRSSVLREAAQGATHGQRWGWELVHV